MSSSLADGSGVVWSSELLLGSVGDSGVAARLSKSSSAFFFLLKETPQLLARLASVPVAVRVGRAGCGSLLCTDEPAPRGDVLGMWYDVALCLGLRIFAMPSDIDPSGEGVLGKPKGFPSPDDGEEASGWSDRAIVGAAFAIVDPETAFPRAGSRFTENREVLDIRDAREPGRSGEGTPGTWCGADPVWGEWGEGKGGGGGEVVVVGDGVLIGD